MAQPTLKPILFPPSPNSLVSTLTPLEVLLKTAEILRSTWSLAVSFHLFFVEDVFYI